MRLFTTNPLQPLGIVENIASNSGGGIFVQGYDNGQFGESQVCGTDYRISANSAAEGSAIFAHNGTFGRTGINFGQHLPERVYLRRCLAGYAALHSQECRLIDDNVAQTLSGQATAGSTASLLQAVSSCTPTACACAAIAARTRCA